VSEIPSGYGVRLLDLGQFVLTEFNFITGILNWRPADSFGIGGS
jgi:hypothetical protein